MAANRFATLIHRKTNRITLLLVYALLEWALIFFILLNSFFSYFILRFADYFGLKRPCLFCSRLDRFFDASGKSPSHIDLLCDEHALEISRERFGYSCSKLESKSLGESRSSSDEFLKDLVDRSAEKVASSDCTPIEPDLGDETRIHNELPMEQPSRSIFVTEEENVGSVNLNPEQRKEEEEEEVNDDATDDDDEFSCYVSSFDCNNQVTTENEEEYKVDLSLVAETSQVTDYKTTESAPENLEFYIDDHDCHLIPVELYKPSEEVREISDINGDFILDFVAEPDFAAEEGRLFPEEISAFPSPEESKTEDSGLNDLLEMQNDEDTDAEVSIGTEIPDHEQIGDIQFHKLVHDDDEDNDFESDTLEFRTVTAETKRPVLDVNQEWLLETQGSMESLCSLHNTMFHLDPRESLECAQGVLTVDKLKSELQEERKALNALYEELEEERSASAIAANETMAMINRLQEEKAAMQMEALQYQRMMEEQSEFDQEALQLLNELVVKREKENVELEKELEEYRKRLEEYETKEKMGMLRRRMRDSSVDSYRNNGDSDDNNGESQNKTVEGFSDCKYRESEMENTPVDVALTLDECLDDYEGERLSILGRLKFLEEKLTALNDEEEEQVKTYENNGCINGNGHFHGKETNRKQRVIIKSKRLLPLFDAVDEEMMENGVDESEKGESITVEDEVDELYERVEALEADREFLRHCVGSLKKGDKGVNLLHQILKHLRELRNIDLIRISENEHMTL